MDHPINPADDACKSAKEADPGANPWKASKFVKAVSARAVFSSGPWDIIKCLHTTIIADKSKINNV